VPPPRVFERRTPPFPREYRRARHLSPYAYMREVPRGRFPNGDPRDFVIDPYLSEEIGGW
jgi:hypothetical protein